MGRAGRAALPVLLALLLTLPGCYYGQLASGQWRLLAARRPIAEWLADPALDAETRERLALVEEARRFAERLGFEVSGQYEDYVDWPGDRIVTTIVRTRPESVKAVPFRFPFVGALPYKGYFDRESAEREAARLREEGPFQVCVSGVPAYSTLGWLDDPVTGPMLRRGTASLIETVLHELVHATTFLRGETAFNESAAQFIGQEAAARFFATPAAQRLPGAPSPERVRGRIEDRRRFAAIAEAFRQQLETLEGHPQRARLRAEAEAATRARIASAGFEVLDGPGLAERARLSDPCLALRGTYARDLPRHAAVLAALDGDLAAMLARLRRVEAEGLDPEAFYAIGANEAGRAKAASSGAIRRGGEPDPQGSASSTAPS